MYLCGPTVYNYAHIGNARPAVVFDLLARLLATQLQAHVCAQYHGRRMTRSMLLSVETGKPIDEITAQFITAYNNDMGALGVRPPDVEPRATQHISRDDRDDRNC